MARSRLIHPLVASVLLFSVTTVGEVHAQVPAASDGRDVYSVPAECPGVAAFATEVAKRTGARRPPPGMKITIARTAGGYDGRLALDGLTRDLHAATCGELAQALALAVASAAEEAEENDDEPAPSAPAPAPVASPLPTEPSTTNEPVGPPLQRALELPLGAAIGATSVLGVGISPELRLFGGIDHGRGWSLRLGGSVARSAERTTALGSARFERWAATLDGCPVTVREPPLSFAPCGRLVAGVLRGEGESIENAESTSLLWLSVGTGGRLGVNLGRNLFVEADTNVVLPLLRHGFYVRPSDVIQRVPILGVEGSIALGYRFSK